MPGLKLHHRPRPTEPQVGTYWQEGSRGVRSLAGLFSQEVTISFYVKRHIEADTVSFLLITC